MYQQNKNAPSKMYFSTLCSLWIFSLVGIHALRSRTYFCVTAVSSDFFRKYPPNNSLDIETTILAHHKKVSNLIANAMAMVVCFSGNVLSSGHRFNVHCIVRTLASSTLCSEKNTHSQFLSYLNK